MTEDEAIKAILDAPKETAISVAARVIDELPDDVRAVVAPDLEEMAALIQTVGNN